MRARPELSSSALTGDEVLAATTSNSERPVGARTEGPGPIEISHAVTAQCTVVLGQPGGGKTTLLRYLALRHATALWEQRDYVEPGLGSVRFPIFVRISSYVESGVSRTRSLSAYLGDYHRLHECSPSGLDDLLSQQLEGGGCLVLLDGLDEVPEPDDRRRVVYRIEDFIDRHAPAGNRFIVTSRIAGYEAAPLTGNFAHYTLESLDQQQIEKFITRWCHAVEDAQTPEASPEIRHATAQREIDGILNAIRTSSGVAGLAANPLMLCILALIHRTGARLPQKRIELYKLATEVLAQTWRTAQGVPESALVREEFLTPLLSRLGYWMHQHKPTGIATETEVIAVLGAEWARLIGGLWDPDEPTPSVLRDIKDFLQRVRVQTGIFVELAPRQYGFMHLTFEEYYSARHLVARHRTRAQLIRQHLHDPRWEESILLALAFVGLDAVDDAGDLFTTAILAEGIEDEPPEFAPSPHEELLARDFHFALRCIADQIPVTAMQIRRLIKRLAEELVNRPGPARFPVYYQELVTRMTDLHGTDAWSELLHQLKIMVDDPSVDIRLRVAQSFEFGRKSYALAELVGIDLCHVLLPLCRDEYPIVRVAAIRNLPNLYHGDTLVALRHEAWGGALLRVA